MSSIYDELTQTISTTREHLLEYLRRMGEGDNYLREYLTTGLLDFPPERLVEDIIRVSREGFGESSSQPLNAIHDMITTLQTETTGLREYMRVVVEGEKHPPKIPEHTDSLLAGLSNPAGRRLLPDSYGDIKRLKVEMPYLVDPVEIGLAAILVVKNQMYGLDRVLRSNMISIDENLKQISGLLTVTRNEEITRTLQAKIQACESQIEALEEQNKGMRLANQDITSQLIGYSGDYHGVCSSLLLYLNTTEGLLVDVGCGLQKERSDLISGFARKIGGSLDNLEKDLEDVSRKDIPDSQHLELR